MVEVKGTLIKAVEAEIDYDFRDASLPRAAMGESGVRFSGESLESRPAARQKDINLPLSEVVPAPLLDRLNKGEEVQLGEGLKATIDKEYNVLRFYVGSYPDMNVVNFWMKEGKVTSVEDLRQGPDAGTLAKIASSGGISQEVLTKLGVTSQAVEDANRKAAQSEVLLKRLTADSATTLPHSGQYQGTNTQTVLQGEAHFFTPKDGKVDGLYTFGAGPCSILIGVSRDSSGKVQQVGMAHLDAGVREAGMNRFFSRLQANQEPGSKTEVYIISGERQVALGAIEAAQKAGAEVKLADADLNGERSDAAVVDAEGTVYYGDRMDLAKVDPQKMQSVALERQIASMSPDSLGGGLNIKNH